MKTYRYFEGRKLKSNWRHYAVGVEASIRDVIKVIDERSSQFALVVDEESKLLGTITDGDIRRGILRGLELEESCREVMNRSPKCFESNSSREEVVKLMKDMGLRHIPMVSSEGVMEDVFSLEEVLGAYRHENTVVIMAGGLGKRLGRLTEDCPKPMLDVGGKPILETILDQFIDQGFHRFYISVNYLSEMIKDHFGDGSRWNVDIQYLEEREPLGTAGALSLIKTLPELPFIVMNGDLLTKVNVSQLLDFHEHSKSLATMCVRGFDYRVPYGVVRSEGHRFVDLVEKPLQKFFVNAGIYCLSPEVLLNVPTGEYCDMTTLFESLSNKKAMVSTFPIHEYWRDIGQLPDFKSAMDEYSGVFEG